MKEYKVIYTQKKGSVDSDERDDPSLLENELNYYAEHGWRLITVTRTMGAGNTYDFHLFLERDKTN